VIGADLVVSAPGLHIDRRESAAVEGEVGSPVLADINLQRVGSRWREPKSELVAGTVARPFLSSFGSDPVRHRSDVRGLG
jgi:hypothetical protein